MFSISKYLFILFLFILSGVSCYAQNYNPVINYSFNGTPVNGVKIKTKLPFVNSSQMPTVTIEGYTYGTEEVIGISLVWYIYNNAFTAYSASSFGSYTPTIKLANENGFVVIFIEDKPYFQRFTVRAFAKGLPSDQSSSFQDWTIADEVLTGTGTVTVNYKTRLGQITSVNGNVGIGTASPSEKLTVEGHTKITNGYNLHLKAAESRPSDPGDLVFQKFSGDELARIFVGGNGEISFAQGTTINQRMILGATGNLGIGVSPDNNYRLSVLGKIRATEIKVEATPWPDYVFAKDYKLPSLKETEQHINEKGHLPGIPSAAEVKANGIDVGEMNAKLLQKIEELTLHIINLEKRIEEMESAKTKK